MTLLYRNLLYMFYIQMSWRLGFAEGRAREQVDPSYLGSFRDDSAPQTVAAMAAPLVSATGSNVLSLPSTPKMKMEAAIIDSTETPPMRDPEPPFNHTREMDSKTVDVMRKNRRARSYSPRRRRQQDRKQTRVYEDEDEWEWDEQARRYYRRRSRSAQRTFSCSWARIPPWASRQRERASGSGSKAATVKAPPPRSPPRAPPTTPASHSARNVKYVSLVPTLEQLGPGVRMWSDAVGITHESEDFTGQDRHLLSNATVFGLARDLAKLNHAQRVMAYCDLIRFLGVLFADLMRTMTRAEEIADEEVLLQVTRPGIGPSMAPELLNNVSQMDVREDLIDNNITELWKGFERIGEANESEMVEGWDTEADDPNLLLEAQETEQPEADGEDQQEDFASYMQVASNTGPMTLFASHLARLQAHFESMTVQQRSSIVKVLFDKLEQWRSVWIMAITSISRDRADRLWALLVTYQGEPGCVEPKDLQWAEARWKELEEMLQIDAVRPADASQFRLASGTVVVNDSQRDAASSSSHQVMVRRTENGEWEPATAEEAAELARKDDDEEHLRREQEAHDELLWQAHQASKAQAWDDWAVASEMDKTSKEISRHAKRFKVTVSLQDKERNELDTTDLFGELENGDVPVVVVSTQEIPEVQQEDKAEREHNKNSTEVAQKDDDSEEDKEDQAETEAAQSDEINMDEGISEEIADLESILETVMGRQWFQLYVDRQVDDVMVSKRWGKRI